MNEKLREAIKIGIIDVDYNEYATTECAPHEFSEEHKKKINKLISMQKKLYYPLVKTTFRRIVTIIAAALVAGSITVGAVPSLRNWLTGLFVTKNETNADVRFADKEITDNYFSVEDHLMTPTYIPNGYVLSIEENDEFTHIVHYTSGTKKIEFSQNDISTGINIDTENADTKAVKIGEYDGFLSVLTDKAILVWTDNSFSYSIIGDLSENDIIDMADSVKLHKLSK